MTSQGLGSGESKLETVVSYILIIGVVISVLLEIIGISLFYRTYGNVQISQNKTVFISGQNFFAFILNQIPTLIRITERYHVYDAGADNTDFNPLHPSNFFRHLFCMGKEPQLRVDNTFCAHSVDE